MFPFNLFKKKKQIIVKFNSQDFEQNEKLASILNENAYLKGELARERAEKSKERTSEEEQNEEQEKIKELNRQSQDLKQKDLQPVSLFKILKHITDKKKKKIKFTTFDGGKVLGDVEDFVIMPDGGLGVVSDKEVIWASKDINHVFFWITGLSNFARNGIIPLCINAQGEFTPNLQTEEMCDLVKMSDGKFKISKVNKKPMYEMVADLHEELNETNNELVAVESALSEQQKEIHEKVREAELHKGRADKIESELSMALTKVAEIEKANGQIVRESMALINLKEINEELIDSMEKVVKKWGEKIEDEIGYTHRDREWEDLKSKLNWAKQNLPQTIYMQPEKEPKPSLTEGIKPTIP